MRLRAMFADVACVQRSVEVFACTAKVVGGCCR
jgi:hypothetical protein